MNIFFTISTGKLIAHGYEDGFVEIQATSGKDNCMNNSSLHCQKQSWLGPLPVGEYYINPDELSDPNFIGDVARMAGNILKLKKISLSDWGDYRIRLHPYPGTPTYGRDNFFIHGGIWDGSAGCIDIGGSLTGNQNTDTLLEMIKSQDSRINVYVLP
jgi:hypothetical protein